MYIFYSAILSLLYSVSSFAGKAPERIFFFDTKSSDVVILDAVTYKVEKKIPFPGMTSPCRVNPRGQFACGSHVWNGSSRVDLNLKSGITIDSYLSDDGLSLYYVDNDFKISRTSQNLARSGAVSLHEVNVGSGLDKVIFQHALDNCKCSSGACDDNCPYGKIEYLGNDYLRIGLEVMGQVMGPYSEGSYDLRKSDGKWKEGLAQKASTAIRPLIRFKDPEAKLPGMERETYLSPDREWIAYELAPGGDGAMEGFPRVKVIKANAQSAKGVKIFPNRIFCFWLGADRFLAIKTEDKDAGAVAIDATNGTETVLPINPTVGWREVLQVQ